MTCYDTPIIARSSFGCWHRAVWTITSYHNNGLDTLVCTVWSKGYTDPCIPWSEWSGEYKQPQGHTHPSVLFCKVGQMRQKGTENSYFSRPSPPSTFCSIELVREVILLVLSFKIVQDHKISITSGVWHGIGWFITLLLLTWKEATGVNVR